MSLSFYPPGDLPIWYQTLTPARRYTHGSAFRAINTVSMRAGKPSLSMQTERSRTGHTRICPVYGQPERGLFIEEQLFGVVLLAIEKRNIHQPHTISQSSPQRCSELGNRQSPLQWSLISQAFKTNPETHPKQHNTNSHWEERTMDSPLLKFMRHGLIKILARKSLTSTKLSIIC